MCCGGVLVDVRCMLFVLVRRVILSCLLIRK